MPENRRRFRNPVAQSPLLRKGGPHQKSRSAERQQQRQSVMSALDEWQEEIDALDKLNQEQVLKGTGPTLLFAA